MKRLGAVLVAGACIACFLPAPLAPLLAVTLAMAGALIIDRTVLLSALRLSGLLAIALAAALTGAAVAWSAGAARGAAVAGTLLSRL